jgi:hypothetical protein
MDKETIAKYAPAAMVIIALIFQWNLFVTPDKLEQKHREILTDIADRYTTKEQFNDVKNQLSDMQKKIDKIYEKIIK